MGESFVIDLWSDVVCPFCYLGTRQLHQALERFDHHDRVTIRHRAFELDPGAKLSYDRPLVELVANKYAIHVSQVHALHQRLESNAAALGMTWSLDIAKPTNTFDAHRVIALASTQSLGDQMSERLFRAYFSEGALVSDHEELETLAGEVGVANVAPLWDGDALVQEVRADEAAAQELGISGVPCFIVDSNIMVAGAQGSDEILEVLRRAWDRRAA